jgi:hypothetical protein
MADIEYANERLQSYLDSEEYRCAQIKGLLAAVINDNDNVKAKYDLLCFLMDHETNLLIIKNLSERLKEIYLSDKDINSYLDHSVRYNPLFQEITIDAFHRRAIDDDSSKYITIKCKLEDRDSVMTTVKEVLTMMLIETKSIKEQQEQE